MSITYPRCDLVAGHRLVRTTPWLHETSFLSHEKHADGSPRRDYWIRRTKWQEGFQRLATGEQCLVIYVDRIDAEPAGLWNAQFPATLRVLERLGYDAETLHERVSNAEVLHGAGRSPYWVEIDGPHLPGRPMVCLTFPPVVSFELHVEHGEITTIISGRTIDSCVESLRDRLPGQWPRELALRWIECDDFGSMVTDAVNKAPKAQERPVVLKFEKRHDRMLLVGTTEGVEGEPGTAQVFKAEMMLEIYWGGITRGQYYLPINYSMASPYHWPLLPGDCQRFLLEHDVTPHAFNRRVEDLLSYVQEGSDFWSVPTVGITFPDDDRTWIAYAVKGVKNNLEFRLPVAQDFTYEVNSAGNAVLALATREDLCDE